MSGAEIVSLGCRLNIAESERIAALLPPDEDVVVINSCAVTREAVRTTRRAIRKAKRDRPGARVLVTGCAADIEGAQLAAMPEVAALVPNTRKLEARLYAAPDTPAPIAPPQPTLLQTTPPSTQHHTRAFIAVQNGCDHACTFCVIPQGRGPSRSLTIAQVLREVERDLAAGAAEIVLTGVDVTSWGHDLPGAPPLGALVAAILDAFPTLPRLRLSSLDGIEIDATLFDLLAHETRVMPHLHLSLQHGHDLILKRMKRRHARADAVDLVARLRALRPDIAIGADLIAGFPTETDAHHAANLSILGELGIVHGHIFPYSPRPRTPAARMPQVARDVVKARAAQMRAAVAQTRAAWLATLVGHPQSVLAERDGTGHAPNFARLAVPPGTTPGAIVTVTPVSVEKGLLR